MAQLEQLAGEHGEAIARIGAPATFGLFGLTWVQIGDIAQALAGIASVIVAILYSRYLWQRTRIDKDREARELESRESAPKDE